MKLKHDKLLSNSAFNCALRHYSTALDVWREIESAADDPDDDDAHGRDQQLLPATYIILPSSNTVRTQPSFLAFNGIPSRGSRGDGEQDLPGPSQ